MTSKIKHCHSSHVRCSLSRGNIVTFIFIGSIRSFVLSSVLGIKLSVAGGNTLKAFEEIICCFRKAIVHGYQSWLYFIYVIKLC